MNRSTKSRLTLGLTGVFLLGLLSTNPLWGQTTAWAQATPAKSKAKAKKKRPKKVKTRIHWLIQPKSVEIYLDTTRLGKAGDLEFTTTSPGKHTIRLVNGKDETEFDLKISENQTLRFEFIFES